MSDRLTFLGPDGTPHTARAVVESLDLRGEREGPRVVGVMIASADGRAVLGTRSVGLGNPADRALFRELRSTADVVLVGSRTLAAERYANLLDPEHRERREAAGLSPHPVVATVSRSLDLAPIPLLEEAGVTVQVYTEAEAPVPKVAADLRVERLQPLTMRGILGHLAATYDAQVVDCEGGPTLLGCLVAEAVLSDLLLTISPLLAGGPPLTVLDATPFPAPVPMDLRAVLRGEDHVFLHYAL